MLFGKKTAALVVVAAILTPLAFGACPNKCSGHGSCAVNDVCVCQQNWLGGDCSLRQCPYTRAWHDTAKYTSDGHYYAECGNRGVCDRTTGICTCDPGYTGSGCRRMSCPEDCSGHGTCEFQEEFAKDTDDKRYGVAKYGFTSAITYAGWDQEKIMGCKCDPGYEGHNCASRICPKGDDPLTGASDQNDMKQVIRIAQAAPSFFLRYYDPYGNKYTTNKIVVTGTAFNTGNNEATVCTAVQTALRDLPNHALEGVTVAASSGPDYHFTRASVSSAFAAATGTVTTSSGMADSTTAHRCVVTFPSSPGTTGLQHLLTCESALHNTAGMFPMATSAAFTCDVYEYHNANSLTTYKLTEIAECSGRGICDGETGICNCFAGHKGLACESQEALV